MTKPIQPKNIMVNTSSFTYSSLDFERVLEKNTYKKDVLYNLDIIQNRRIIVVV
jgi:hypothetical protein